MLNEFLDFLANPNLVLFNNDYNVIFIITIIFAIGAIVYFARKLQRQHGGSTVPFPKEDCIYAQKTRNCKCVEFDDRKIFCTKFVCPSGYTPEPYCSCEATCWNTKGINEQVKCSQSCMKNFKS